MQRAPARATALALAQVSKWQCAAPAYRSRRQSNRLVPQNSWETCQASLVPSQDLTVSVIGAFRMLASSPEKPARLRSNALPATKSKTNSSDEPETVCCLSGPNSKRQGPPPRARQILSGLAVSWRKCNTRSKGVRAQSRECIACVPCYLPLLIWAAHKVQRAAGCSKYRALRV